MKPYRVQAYRPGQFQTWFTDSSAETVADAIEQAKRLHVDWNRKVRVINAVSGQTLFRLPAPARRSRRGSES